MSALRIDPRTATTALTANPDLAEYLHDEFVEHDGARFLEERASTRPGILGRLRTWGTRTPRAGPGRL